MRQWVGRVSRLKATAVQMYANKVVLYLALIKNLLQVRENAKKPHLSGFVEPILKAECYQNK
jgi:hypothetical protein